MDIYLLSGWKNGKRSDGDLTKEDRLVTVRHSSSGVPNLAYIPVDHSKVSYATDHSYILIYFVYCMT